MGMMLQKAGRAGSLIERCAGTCPTPNPAADDLLLPPCSGFISPPISIATPGPGDLDDLQDGWKFILEMSCSYGF